MQPKKLNIGIAGYPYGGNGATSSLHPDIKDWTVLTVLAAKADERIGEVFHKDFSDTPITMTRNASVEWAKKAGVDVLLMVDSDQAPDMYVGSDPLAKPFFASSFDFLYAHYDKGPVTIVAPYCGPPGHPVSGGWENVYVFKWANQHSDEPQRDEFKLDAFDRDEASRLMGISEIGAGPTGLCMIDMRAFQHMTHPYFYYQYEGDGELCPRCHQHAPGPQAQKSTTEDVAFFRDMSLAISAKLGYNPVFCNWDSWAGHWKPKCVGKPTALKASQISQKMRDALDRGEDRGMRIMNVQPPKDSKASIPFARQPDSTNCIVRVNGTDYQSQELAPTSNMDVADQQALKDVVSSYASAPGVVNRKIRIVELGSWVGHSAKLMADAVAPMCDYEIFCVDHWKGGMAQQRHAAEQHDVMEVWEKNVASVREHVHPFRGDTVEVGNAWTETGEGSIDILFIDADHSYEGCLADIEAWSKHVIPNGIIMGHDYSFVFPGVKRAVHEVFGWDVPTVGNSIWVTRKPREVTERFQQIVGDNRAQNPFGRSVSISCEEANRMLAQNGGNRPLNYDKIRKAGEQLAQEARELVSETEVAQNGQEK